MARLVWVGYSLQLVQVAVVPALGGAHRRHSRYDALYFPAPCPERAARCSARACPPPALDRGTTVLLAPQLGVDGEPTRSLRKNGEERRPYIGQKRARRSCSGGACPAALTCSGIRKPAGVAALRMPRLLRSEPSGALLLHVRLLLVGPSQSPGAGVFRWFSINNGKRGTQLT